MDEYEQEFQIFATNIRSAARSFYYHRELMHQVYTDGLKHQQLPNGYFQDSKMYQAMNSNSQFWETYNFSSIFHTILTLGRIFDKDPRSHSINRLSKLIKRSCIFSKEELRKRKISESDNANEWIDEYIDNVNEFSQEDYQSIFQYIAETLEHWDCVKDVRNKLYAHQDVLGFDRKSEIREKATYDVIEKIIARLLTIEHILWEAFHNGRTPYFEYTNKEIFEKAKADVSSLLSRLSNQ